MQEKSLLERGASILDSLTINFGPESGALNAVIITLVVATGLIGIGLLVVLISSRRKGEDVFASRVEGMLQKFERSERHLNEFRAEALRHLERTRVELDLMRADFERISELLSEQIDRSIAMPDLDSSLVARAERIHAPTKSSGATGLDEAKEIVPQDEPIHQTTLEVLSPSTEIQPEIAPASDAPEPLAPLGQRLKKSRVGFFEKIRSVFAGKPKLDEESVADLEAILVGSDLGIKTATAVLAEVKEDVKAGADINEGGLAGILKQKLLGILERGAPGAPIMAPRRREDGPLVVMVVGVNGAGKTTSVAKLAHQWRRQGSSVLMVAADTFRAAAVEQLHEWGRRLCIPVVSGAPNAKPQTVVYDAMARAAQEPIDVVIIDTAGRLHTKLNLMEELSGIRNAIDKHIPGAPDEVLLVVDGSTGQNAVIQAREFNAATALTGLIVTKLDGTSKGGVVVAIKEELGIPLRYIGVGEGAEDLRPFVPRDFVEALLGHDPSDSDGSVSVNAATRRQRRAPA
jgi:fused signal recognition particle receptor